MLKIRAEQMQVFEMAALQNFEEEMVAHSKTFAPEQCRAIGDAAVRVAVKSMIEKTKGFGFTLRGPIRLCVELAFLCGSDFDSDPVYWRLAEILRSSNSEMLIAERIHQAQLQALEAIGGPGNINVRRAEEAILAYAQKPTMATEETLETELLHEMSRAFRQRTAYVGEDAIRRLIAEGRTEARKHGLVSVRGQTLIVLLMSAFGHGCTNDPLQPWIHQTLVDPLIVDAAARETRLERRSLTWLQHVLNQNPEPPS